MCDAKRHAFSDLTYLVCGVLSQQPMEVQMTKTNKINYHEVLRTNIVANHSDSKTQAVMSRLNGFVKYLFKSNMGNIDRLLTNLKKEYEEGAVVMQDMLHDDYDADAKGGYGRGSYERKTGFGFPTNIDDLEVKLDNTNTCIEILQEFMDFNQDDYEIVFGTRFEGNLVKNNQSSGGKNTMTSKRKEELRKKYETAK